MSTNTSFYVPLSAGQLVLPNSNVGIGTTIPLARLHVYEGTISSDLLRIDDVASGQDTTPFVVNASGNVGIGTPNPQAPLSVTGNILASGTISSGTGMMFRNAVINGDMRINQRVTSSNLGTPTVVGATFGYVVDRFGVYRTSYQTGATMAQGSNLGISDLPFTDTGINTFARIGRVQGDTGTNAIHIAYGLETQDSQRFIGRFVTLSFYYRTGAGFSGTQLDAIIISGTGYDEGFQRGATITGNTVAGSLNLQVSSSWRYVSLTAQISSSANQIGFFIRYIPTGTSPANEFFDITGVQLERGTVATPFEFRPFSIELQLCLRYYEKSYALNTAPGTSTTVGNWIFNGSSDMNSNTCIMIKYSVIKRAKPIVTAYRTDGTVNSVAYARSGVSFPTASTPNMDNGSNEATCSLFTAVGAAFVATIVVFQWTANAEL